MMTSTPKRNDAPLTVFVTGGSGLIGKSVVRALLARGHRVRALVRSGALPMSSTNLTIIQGDLTEKSDVRRAAVGCTHVIHLAARKADEKDSVAVNVGGTENTLEASRAESVTRFLHVSTPSAALKTAGTYGKTKHKAEELVQGSGLPFVIVRPSVVYADMHTGIVGSIRKFLNLPIVPIIGSGETTYAPIHADDLAELFVDLLTADHVLGGVFDAGGPETLSFNDMIEQSMDVLGIRKPVLHVPVWLAALLAQVFSVLPKPPITRSNIRGATENVPLDLEKLRSVLPYRSRTFRQALKECSAGVVHHSREAATLLTYVVRGTPHDAELQRYEEACRVHRIPEHTIPTGMVLKMMDASTKFFAPSCVLQKKLLIAAAIAETSPRTADVLLPKNRSYVSIALTLIIAGLSSAVWLAGGLCMKVLFPSSWNAYAGR